MRFLRMLTNSLLAGALGAAFLTIVVVQLNPHVPLASATPWRWFVTLGLLYGVHIAVACYVMIVAREFFAMDPMSPGWASVRVLAWLSAALAAAAAVLMWLNVSGFEQAIGDEAARRMTTGAMATTASALVLLTIAIAHYSFGRRGSRVGARRTSTASPSSTSRCTTRSSASPAGTNCTSGMWSGRTASPEAAAAAAAPRRNYFPAQATTLDQSLAASSWPALRRNPVAKKKGIAYGLLAADRIIALRTGDGRNAVVTVPTGTTPGHWRPEPATALFTSAWLGGVIPLRHRIRRSSSLLAHPRAAINTGTYLEEFNEVRDFGGQNADTMRTAEQSQTARFYSDAGIVPMQAGLSEFARPTQAQHRR